MKNLFFMLVLIFISVGIISSCSSDEEVAATAATNSENAATIGLNGTFNAPCRDWGDNPGSSTSSFIFSGAKVVSINTSHTADGCATSTIGRLDNTTYTMVPSTTANTITIEADNSSGTGYKAVLTLTATTRVNKHQA